MPTFIEKINAYVFRCLSSVDVLVVKFLWWRSSVDLLLLILLLLILLLLILFLLILLLLILLLLILLLLKCFF